MPQRPPPRQTVHENALAVAPYGQRKEGAV